MQQTINLSMNMLEYNELVESLNDLRNHFCNLFKEKKDLLYSSADMSYIRELIEIIFFSIAIVIPEESQSPSIDVVPEAAIANVLSNDESNSAIDALQRAINQTRDLVSKM
jgi:hypothetical protein